MRPIAELISKLQWDSKEHPEEYSFFYIDRIENAYKEIRYSDIIRKEGRHLMLNPNGEEVEIPLHRIMLVKKRGWTIWRR